jgi:hypothetical protein
MINKTLRTVRVPHADASILEFHVTPCIKSDGDVNLQCGGCCAVLCEGVSDRFFANFFATPAQLLIHCPECLTYNVLPSQWMPENAAFG